MTPTENQITGVVEKQTVLAGTRSQWFYYTLRAGEGVYLLNVISWQLAAPFPNPTLTYERLELLVGKEARLEATRRPLTDFETPTATTESEALKQIVADSGGKIKQVVTQVKE